MNELWLPVVGYEGFYEVSNQGRVRSLDREGRHSFGGIRTWKGKILKPSLSTKGYLRVSLHREGQKSKHRVHRLVCIAFHGPCPSNDHVVDHIDENKLNNKLINLRWLPLKENVGRSTAGSKNRSARLTEADVLAIRSDSRDYREVAKAYGVSHRHVHRIRAKRKWAHVA